MAKPSKKRVKDIRKPHTLAEARLVISKLKEINKIQLKRLRDFYLLEDENKRLKERLLQHEQT